MTGDRLLLNAGEVNFLLTRVDVAAELQLRIGRLKCDFYSNESGRVDYQTLRDSEEFEDYCVCCRQLQEYDLLHLKTPQEKIACHCQNPAERIFLQEIGSKARIEWLEYDWTLNS